MNPFRRRTREPDAAKGAEFHPTVRETILVLGGGWYTGTYGAMYRRQPAVRATVDFLSRNIAQLNAKVYERVSNTDRLEIDDHPLALLLRNPNQLNTRFAHMRDTVADIAIYDRAYWRKFRYGRNLAVVRISPAKLNVQTIEGRRTYRTAEGVEIPRSQLVIFPGYSPDTDDEGVSPLETLRRVLQDEASIAEHRETMWRNTARQSGWIKRPTEAPPWSDDARQRFRADLESTMAGPRNAGRIGVLEEGMSWDPSRFTIDTDYIEARRLTYEEVAIVYGMDPSIIGMGSETKANAEEYHIQLYQDVFGPWLRMLQDEIELQLLPEFEPLRRYSTYLEFNIAEKMRGSFEEQARSLATTVGAPTVSVNEGRAKMNLPRIDDPAFDVPIRPLNVLYGGQAAPTVPTADPSTAPQALALTPPGRLPPLVALPVATKALKAPPAAIERRERAVKQHVELLRKYFDRQQRDVLSAKRADDASRWNRELTADLFMLATGVTRETGAAAAQQINGVYDPDLTFAYLETTARAAAEAINAHTFELIDEAEDADEMRHVFEVAKGSRGEQIALGQATMLINFARTEAGKQTARDGREVTKTWVTTSPKSRHPQMNGESVAVDDVFSNGMRWPGDSSGGADEVAGCHCLLSID